MESDGVNREKGVVLIIENDPEVPPGILRSLLQEEGLDFQVIRLHTGESCDGLSGATGLVVLGGAMSAFETDRFPFLHDVKHLIQAALDSGLPMLGICLGGQLVAEVTGGRVSCGTHGERGLQEIVLTREGTGDPLFSGLPDLFSVFQWHNDSFHPPKGAVLLAGSARCPHQAFRFGTSAYGIQFHPEVDALIVNSWASAEPEPAQIESLPRRHSLGSGDTAPVRLLKNFIRMTKAFPHARRPHR
jgi:GMP synthase-like glutamine amidotransferase